MITNPLKLIVVMAQKEAIQVMAMVHRKKSVKHPRKKMRMALFLKPRQK